MGLFSKKEKNVIPEVGRPGMAPRENSARGKPGEPDTEVRDRRYTGRQAPSYNPQATPGAYGNYGNYGAGGGVAGGGQPQQQPPMMQQNAGPGYGSYGNAPAAGPNASQSNYGYNQPAAGQDARSQLLAGARAPNAKTGAAFDEYSGASKASGRYKAPTGGAEYGDNAEYGDSGNGNNAEYGDSTGGEQEQANEEDDEVEAIKQQIRFTKQESLSTTRNAIRTAQEAEMTASNTLARLGEQTDRIANTELALDKAKGYNSRAADGAKEIAKLNQSIFRPTFTFNKELKRNAEEQRVLARHLEEKNEREEARKAAYESRVRVEQGFQEAERSNKFGKGKGASAPTGRAKWEQGGRYQFEASNSDDELEQELDNNLDEIAAITGRLKILAGTAGKEIDAQNKHLDRIGGKVDTLDDKITMNTSYLKRIK